MSISFCATITHITQPFISDELTRSICGETRADIETFSNKMLLKFISLPRSSRRMGFLVNINASIETCGGTLEGSIGILQTPGYPHGYPHSHYCTWTIIGPPDRRIKLSFQDFDLEPAYIRNNRSVCPYDYVYVTSGSRSEFLTPAFDPRCGTNIPEDVSSSANVMRVAFKSDGSVSHRGFNASWSTDEPALCGGILTASSGIISSPMTANMSYPDRVYCHWTLSPRSYGHGTLVLTILDQIHFENGCHDFLSVVRGADLDSAQRLAKICGGETASSNFILSPGHELTHVIFKSDATIHDRGFNMSFSYNDCGGTMNGPFNNIRASGTDLDCIWLLQYEEGQQIELSRFSLNMENSDSVSCGQRGASYVIVRNGGEPDSPILWQGCGNTQVLYLFIIPVCKEVNTSFNGLENSHTSALLFLFCFSSRAVSETAKCAPFSKIKTICRVAIILVTFNRH